MTAYTNNIWLHYPKYLKKYVCCTLFRDRNLGDGTKGERKRARREAAQITNSLLYDLETVLDVTPYQHLLPHQESENRLYDMKTNPWVYLKSMVTINRLLETDFFTVPDRTRRLPSQFDQHLHSRTH